jgi:hypothetical protein
MPNPHLHKAEEAGWKPLVVCRDADGTTDLTGTHRLNASGCTTYYPESSIQGLVEALRYISGEDVPGFGSHVPLKLVARRALASFKQEVE